MQAHPPETPVTEAQARLVRTEPVLASLDMQRTVGFYRDVLEFEVVHLAPGEWLILARDDIRLHFWACPDRKFAEATSCRVEVTGIAQLYRQVEDHGAAHPNAPLRPTPWNTTEFAILDPDGNLVTFYQWN